MTVDTKKTPIQGEWECNDCGYYVSGISSKIPPKSLPDRWLKAPPRFIDLVLQSYV